jgi:hypothetical protein
MWSSMSGERKLRLALHADEPEQGHGGCDAAAVLGPTVGAQGPLPVR